jgi:hypothetical protein
MIGGEHVVPAREVIRFVNAARREGLRFNVETNGVSDLGGHPTEYGHRLHGAGLWSNARKQQDGEEESFHGRAF